MTKFEVTESMVEGALIKWHDQNIGSHNQSDFMHAAITAAIEASGLVERLDNCESRLWAVLHRDDGQDYKEGRRYLEKHRPDLIALLDAHESEAAEFLEALHKDVTND